MTEETAAPEEGAEPGDSVETEARQQGWKPLDEWVADGRDAKTHKSAEVFLAKGSPDQIRIRENGELKAEIASLRQLLSETAAKVSKSAQTAYQRALKDAEAKRIQAISEGDVEAFKQAETEVENVRKELESEGPKEDPMVAQFRQENSWANAPSLQSLIAQTYEVISLEKGLSPATVDSTRLNELHRRMHEARPTLVGRPAFMAESVRKAPASPESGGNGAGGGRNDFAKLPDEGKEIFEDYYRADQLRGPDGKPFPKTAAGRAEAQKFYVAQLKERGFQL